MSAPDSREPGENLPRSLHGTDVVLWESPGRLKLEWPIRSAALLAAGAVWIGVIAAALASRRSLEIPSWILVGLSLPGLFVLIVGGFRAGRSMRFELGPDRFVARGLGFFARTEKSWNRSEILRFKTRDTSAVVRDSPIRVRLARLLVELRSGGEEVLVRQGDGLALGHIAVFLSKALEAPPANAGPPQGPPSPRA